MCTDNLSTSLIIEIDREKRAETNASLQTMLPFSPTAAPLQTPTPSRRSSVLQLDYEAQRP